MAGALAPTLASEASPAFPAPHSVFRSQSSAPGTMGSQGAQVSRKGQRTRRRTGRTPETPSPSPPCPSSLPPAEEAETDRHLLQPGVPGVAAEPSPRGAPGRPELWPKTLWSFVPPSSIQLHTQSTRKSCRSAVRILSACPPRPQSGATLVSPVEQRSLPSGSVSTATHSQLLPQGQKAPKLTT
ncbi:zinc finger RNA-binding protein-like [Gorilla gorilla gorilla]|uniref:zinc finger RNA-binding protein-like n=1 Tax=Gorilla gorilla gorilla TaxID=9595 RepID=UPI00300B7CF2